MSDFTIGLIVTGLGLAGVFLVLGLFFVSIKLLQHLEPREDNE